MMLLVLGYMQEGKQRYNLKPSNICNHSKVNKFMETKDYVKWILVIPNDFMNGKWRPIAKTRASYSATKVHA